MRLTLRTLLAHRDGILPTAFRKDIEKQIEENAAADDLEKRVRHVIARAGMSSPKVDGRGLGNDPNSVAEFLDNTLRTDQIENFERICLQSDLHLSEVAACHEILAQILRHADAVEGLEKSEYEQLKQHVHHEFASEFSRQEKEEAKKNAAIVQAAIASAPRLPTSIHGAVPLQQNKLKQSRKRLPTWSFVCIAFLLLICSGGALVWKVLGERGRFVVEENVLGQSVTDLEKVVGAGDMIRDAEDTAVPKTVAPIAENDGRTARKEDVAVVLPEEGKQEPVNPEVQSPLSDSMPTDMPMDTLPKPTPRQHSYQQVPQGHALAIASKQTEMGMVESEPTGSINVPAVKDTNLGEVANKGVLLHRIFILGRPSWVYFSPGELLAKEEDLLVPPGSDAEINLDGMAIKLLGGTQARLTVDGDGTRRITVILGKTVIHSVSTDNQVGISAGRLHGVITAGLDHPIAACVDFSRQPGDDPTKTPSRMESKIISTVGGISWRQIPTADLSDSSTAIFLSGIAEEGMLPAHTALVWDSNNPDIARTMPESGVLWLSDAFVANPNTRRASEFLRRILQGGDSFDQALSQMSNSHRIENRILSVATYALLGNYDELVILLSNDAPGQKLEAMQWLEVEESTVPLAMARGHNSAIKLRQAFIEHMPSQKGSWLFQMACGFDNRQLESGADKKLVESLGDDELVVRRYATKNLFEILKPQPIDRVRYRPDGPNEIREKGMKWWRARLDDQAVRWTVPR